MAWADAHPDHPFSETLRRMTDKTVYRYSKEVKFGMNPDGDEYEEEEMVEFE